MAPRVSLCMIVKDEEENLRRCLASVAGVVDEVVVVDTGSGDGTVGVAREFGAAVYTFPWNGSFGEARNASLEPATGDWILFLDADEELARESGPVLRRLVTNEAVEGYFVKIVNYLGHEGWVETSPDLVFRLFRNRRDYRFRGAVHEQIADVILERNPGARYEVAEDLVIFHYGYLDRQIRNKDKKNRNLALLQEELRHAPENPVLRYHYGVELYRAERYEEAAEELLRAAGACPPQAIYLPKLWRTVVLAYQAAGRYDEALRAVETALALFPDYADLYYYGGLLCLEQKHYGRAYEFFSRALALPGQPTHYAPFAGTQGFRTHYHLGRLAEAFLNEEEAMRHYVSSLRDNPAFTPALESIARLLRPRENPDDARGCLEQLCEFCTPQAHLLMGEILFRLAAYRLALEYLERGTAGREVLPEVLLWKIICLM
ncbi:MAG: glycosyltransferase, partial [Firmicutes bacterium]|nr:glycosyltransferase [Bacillota bacterium]